jgi:hypothetical protein
VPFTSSLSILWKNAGPKLFCRAKSACFGFSSSNFLLLGHIASTLGAAQTVQTHTDKATLCCTMISKGKDKQTFSNK